MQGGGGTAFSFAISAGLADILQLLLEKGEDPKAKVPIYIYIHVYQIIICMYGSGEVSCFDP